MLGLKLSDLLLIVAGAILLFNIVLVATMFSMGYVRIDIGPEEEKTAKRVDVAKEVIIYEPGMDSLAFTHYKQFEASQKERERLKMKQAEIAMDTSRMNILMGDLVDKEVQIDGLKRAIEKLVAESDALERNRLKHLAKIYDTMRPAEAAPIISALPDDLIIRIMRLMKKRQVGKILGRMKKNRAALISEKLGYIDLKAQAKSIMKPTN